MNLKQTLFIEEYCKNGFNASKAYKKAYPDCQIGYQQNGSKLLLNTVIKQAIETKKAENESLDKNSRINIDARFNQIYTLCMTKGDYVNATRACENQAKNRGYYALDNAQRTEQAKLDEQQTKEAKEYAKWRLLKGLSEPKQAQEAG